jgi:DNA adenine methylase
MPGYQGGKSIGADFILRVLNDERLNDRPYVEPFCGMCNIISRVHSKPSYLASDSNALLIHFHMALQRGEALPEITRERYQELRNQKDLISTERATACFAYSFNSIPWGGFVNLYTRKNGRVDDIPASRKRAYQNLQQRKPFQKTEFTCCDYRDLKLPPQSVMYCDIPYEGTKGYMYGGAFDHGAFWATARDWTAQGHLVFISEYNSPPDFLCIAERSKQGTLGGADKQNTRTERLFVHSSALERVGFLLRNE